ncbi:hypothetical protein O6H91_18G074500 [Diphasiastrum complanatum]|nr:hypothetical protein O6H91_18G074500 [Diphasiastrum complanatum]
MKTVDIISLILKLPNLTSLSIIFDRPLLFTVDLEGIANNFPSQLVSLDLHVAHLVTPLCHVCIDTPPPFIHEGFLKQLQQKCPNLRVLDLDGDIPTTSRGLDDLLSVYSSLTSLDLSSHEIGWPEVEKIFKGCKHLQHLSLVSPLFIKSANNGDDDNDNFDAHTSSSRRVGRYPSRTLQRVSSRLDLESCFPGCLSSIRFYSSPHRSVPLDLDPLFGLIRGRGQQLQHLHGHSLFNTSWHTISIWCANLQSLDLSYASNKLLELTGVEEVVLCGLPRLLKKLRRVALPTATDRILVEFGHFCPDLKELQFQGYGHGTVNLLPQISVTDRGVVALAEGCNALTVLNLAGSQNITISSIRALAFHCRSLKVLMLNGCHNLRHDGFLALLPRLAQSLVLLDLVGSKIDLLSTMKMFEHLLVHGSSLRVLAIPNIRNKSLRLKAVQLKLRLPSLDIRSASSGIEWDGFYHARSLVED